MQPVSKEELLEIVDAMREGIATGDSYEGFLNWLLPDNLDDPTIIADVEARWRVGNLKGQGGMNMIGVDHNRQGGVSDDPVVALNFQLMQCMQERTKQAEYAVMLENKIAELEKVENLIPEYIAKYIAKFQELNKTVASYRLAVQHLLDHLQDAPVYACADIHEWLKGQGFK